MRVLPFCIALSCLFLAACENEAASHLIEGKDHSISLVREQRWFWSDQVDQKLVVARFPACQRRFEIAPGNTSGVKVELYSVRPRLFVAHQGAAWYAVSSEECQLQKFDSPPEQYGEPLGAFEKRDGKLVFVPAAAEKNPATSQ